MKVYIRPLNKGETFCCSIKKAKELFKDTEISLNFAMFGRRFGTFAETPDGYYWKRHVKGRIIASMQLMAKQAHTPLSFYVLKESQFSADLKEEFEKNYLPEFYRLYQEQQNNENIGRSNKLMLVELLDGTMKLHETAL